MTKNIDTTKGTAFISVLLRQLLAISAPKGAEGEPIVFSAVCELSDDYINAAENAAEEAISDGDVPQEKTPLGDRLMALRRKAIEEGDVELMPTDEILEEAQDRRYGGGHGFDGDSYYQLEDEDIMEVHVDAACDDHNPMVGGILAMYLPNLEYVDGKFKQDVVVGLEYEKREVLLDTLYAVNNMIANVPKEAPMGIRKMAVMLTYAASVHEDFGVVMLPGRDVYSAEEISVVNSINKYTPETGIAEMTQIFGALFNKILDEFTEQSGVGSMCFYPLTLESDGEYRTTCEVTGYCV